MVHHLKILPEYFQAILDGAKTDELRQEDDRTFAVGDVLVLREWDRNEWQGEDGLMYRIGSGYTGRSLTREVTYVLRDPDHRWLQPSVVALSLRETEEAGQ